MKFAMIEGWAINPSLIRYMKPHDGGCRIMFDNSSWVTTTKTLDEVVTIISELDDPFFIQGD